MKNALIILIALLPVFALAQKDTTKIKMGNKKIIIIDNKKRSESDLNKGKEDFEKNIEVTNQKIDDMRDSINNLNETLKNENNDATRSSIDKKIATYERKIAEYEKEVAAFERGIADIDKDIEEINNENDNKNEQIDKETEKYRKEQRRNERHNRSYNEHYFHGHWSGIEIGFNNFMNSNYEMKLPTAQNGMDGQFMELNFSKSWGAGINFLQYSIPLFSNYAGFVTGLGVEFNNYNLKKNVDLYEDVDGIIMPDYIDIAVRKYSKNTLNTIYLNAPLIFEIQLPSRGSNLHLAAGVIGSVKLDSKTQKEYDLNGDKRKEKHREDYQLYPFKYGVTFRLGYEVLNFYANYDLTPLFLKDKGPEIYPFTIGLSFYIF